MVVGPLLKASPTLGDALRPGIWLYFTVQAFWDSDVLVQFGVLPVAGFCLAVHTSFPAGHTTSLSRREEPTFYV